jgi:addiction module HigA family antidote
VKEAARRLGVTRPNLSRIPNGRAGISTVMSVRLAKAMPYTSPEFWLKMQLNYDLSKAKKSRQPKIKPFPARPQKEACLSQGLTSSSKMASTSIVHPWVHKARSMPRKSSRERWKRS